VKSGQRGVAYDRIDRTADMYNDLKVKSIILLANVADKADGLREESIGVQHFAIDNFFEKYANVTIQIRRFV